MIRYENITIDTTMIDQIIKFRKKSLEFELVFKKLGTTRIRTRIRKIAETN